MLVTGPIMGYCPDFKNSKGSLKKLVIVPVVDI